MKEIKWLHISDLHIGKENDDNIEWRMLRKDLSFLDFDFMVFTGDLHNYGSGKEGFEKGIRVIKEIAVEYGLNIMKDVFIVPGNHDVDAQSGIEVTTKFASKRLSDLECSAEDVKDAKGRELSDRFSEYKESLRKLFGGNAEDYSKNVFCRTWGNKINIIHLNTALLSNESTRMEQMVDIDALEKMKLEHPEYPAIVIGHHSFFRLPESQHDVLKVCFQRFNVRAYLYGDVHLVAENWIALDGRRIPCISAPTFFRDPKDTYAQTGASFYTWNTNLPDGKVDVVRYRWYGSRWEDHQSRIKVFSMKNIQMGIWERLSRKLGQDIDIKIVPNLKYSGERDNEVEYENACKMSSLPLLRILEDHHDDKYYQLIGEGKQACGGTGKTYTLLSLAQALTSSQDEKRGITIIPLYLQLKQIYRTGCKTSYGMNQIIEYSKKDYQIDVNKVNDESNENTNVLYLLDGFNELYDSNKQVECIQDVIEIIEQHPNDMIVIASRNSLQTYFEQDEFTSTFTQDQIDQLSTIFNTCYIEELTEEQKKECIKEVGMAVDDQTWHLLSTPFYLKLCICGIDSTGEIAQRWITPSLDTM